MGSNNHGQLGHGNRRSYNEPTIVSQFMRKSKRGHSNFKRIFKTQNKMTNRSSHSVGGFQKRGGRLSTNDTMTIKSRNDTNISSADNNLHANHRYPRGTYAVDVACGPDYMIAIIYHVYKGRFSLYSWGRSNTPTFGDYDSLKAPYKQGRPHPMTFKKKKNKNEEEEEEEEEENVDDEYTNISISTDALIPIHILNFETKYNEKYAANDRFNDIKKRRKKDNFILLGKKKICTVFFQIFFIIETLILTFTIFISF